MWPSFWFSSFCKWGNWGSVTLSTFLVVSTIASRNCILDLNPNLSGLLYTSCFQWPLPQIRSIWSDWAWAQAVTRNDAIVRPIPAFLCAASPLHQAAAPLLSLSEDKVSQEQSPEVSLHLPDFWHLLLNCHLKYLQIFESLSKHNFQLKSLPNYYLQ